MVKTYPASRNCDLIKSPPLDPEINVGPWTDGYQVRLFSGHFSKSTWGSYQCGRVSLKIVTAILDRSSSNNITTHIIYSNPTTHIIAIEIHLMYLRLIVKLASKKNSLKQQDSSFRVLGVHFLPFCEKRVFVRYYNILGNFAPVRASSAPRPFNIRFFK